MVQNSFWRVVLIALICVALVTPARADLNSDARNIVIGIVAVVAAVVVIAVVVVRESHMDRTITGCVNTTPNGMTLTDEKNQRVYALAGSTTGMNAGERIRVKGKKVKAKGANQTPTMVATSLVKDFGLCRP